MEDMCQLAGKLTEQKYQGSYELMAKLIERYSSVPKLDIVNYWEQVVFSWIVGNADMHLKNFSLYSEKPGKYVLTPTYDQVSTAIVMPEDTDQSALPLNGFQKKLLSMDFAQAMEASNLNRQMIQRIFNRFIPLKEKWFACIDESFISAQQKNQFKELINKRIETLSVPF
jgi:serine/threonine-protein kinase HipA